MKVEFRVQYNYIKDRYEILNSQNVVVESFFYKAAAWDRALILNREEEVRRAVR